MKRTRARAYNTGEFLEESAMSTSIAIELPDDIARVLREKWGDLSQHTIEALAAEGYRTRALSGAQVQRMLGLETPGSRCLPKATRSLPELHRS